MNYHAIVNLLFEKGLLKKIPITIPLQDLHLLDGNLIEFHKSFALWYSIIDKHGIDILHIRKAYQFVDSGIVTDIALHVWICLSPLLGSHSKHSYIQHISFLCIYDTCLCSCDFCRNQVTLDGISMNVVVYLGSRGRFS